MPKRDLNSLIKDAQPQKPPIHRGQGYQLSTTNPDAEITGQPATPNYPPSTPKPPTIYRESAKVDKELIREYKVLAAQKKRKIYELMEEALREWLEIHKGESGEVEK